MATVKQYVTQAGDILNAIAMKKGNDITRESKPVRVIVGSFLVIICVIVKLLVDKGVFTNQELSDEFAFARDDTWPGEPIQPPAAP